MNKILSITIKNSNHNEENGNIMTRELTELNTYLEDGWSILDSKIVVLETGGLYFTVLYHLTK